MASSRAFAAELVSTHSRLKAAGRSRFADGSVGMVSTHSRLKAAGWKIKTRHGGSGCFNTQPPEGGWLIQEWMQMQIYRVSTHSRLKAAGCCCRWFSCFGVSFNTQPPEGGWATLYSSVIFRLMFQHTAA